MKLLSESQGSWRPHAMDLRMRVKTMDKEINSLLQEIQSEIWRLE